jgi:ornithine decarboxylase
MPTLVAEESQINNILGTSGFKGSKLVTTLSAEATTFDIIQSIIKTKSTELDSPFSVLDLRVVIDLMNKWTTNLPTVKPFYAVKCNPNISLLRRISFTRLQF